MNVFKTIFIKIGNLMGLELQEKNLTTKTEEIPITQTIANKLSTITLTCLLFTRNFRKLLV